MGWRLLLYGMIPMTLIHENPTSNLFEGSKVRARQERLHGKTGQRARCPELENQNHELASTLLMLNPNVGL
jgi:hypothetical protein